MCDACGKEAKTENHHKGSKCEFIDLCYSCCKEMAEFDQITLNCSKCGLDDGILVRED